MTTGTTDASRFRYRINREWSAERAPDGGVIFKRWAKPGDSQAGSQEELNLSPGEWLDLIFAVSVWARDSWSTRAMMRGLIERIHLGQAKP